MNEIELNWNEIKHKYMEQAEFKWNRRIEEGDKNKKRLYIMLTMNEDRLPIMNYKWYWMWLCCKQNQLDVYIDCFTVNRML